MRGKFHTISFRDAAGNTRTAELPRPEYQIGNAKHWPGGLTTEWQLRPAEPTDAPDGIKLEPGLWVLAKSIPEIGGLYAFVSLPYPLRKNTPKNIQEALRRQRRVNPKIQLIARELEDVSRQMVSRSVASRGGTTFH